MESNFQARILLCAACNEEFAFTIEAQEYFVQKGLVDDPQMCKSCYTESKRVKRSQDVDIKPQQTDVGNGRVGHNSNGRGNKTNIE